MSAVPCCCRATATASAATEEAFDLRQDRSTLNGRLELRQHLLNRLARLLVKTPGRWACSAAITSFTWPRASTATVTVTRPRTAAITVTRSSTTTITTARACAATVIATTVAATVAGACASAVPAAFTGVGNFGRGEFVGTARVAGGRIRGE